MPFVSAGLSKFLRSLVLPYLLTHKEYNMHMNEEFLKKCSPTELFTLEVEAEARGKAYVQAYREQLRRLEIGSINA